MTKVEDVPAVAGINKENEEEVVDGIKEYESDTSKSFIIRPLLQLKVDQKPQTTMTQYYQKEEDSHHKKRRTY